MLTKSMSPPPSPLPTGETTPESVALAGESSAQFTETNFFASCDICNVNQGKSTTLADFHNMYISHRLSQTFIFFGQVKSQLKLRVNEKQWSDSYDANNQKNVRNERKLTAELLLLTFSSPSCADSFSASASSSTSPTDCKRNFIIM